MSFQKTVLVYRNELLPISETFIKEQVLALREWRPVLVGRQLLHQLPLDDLDVRVVGPQRSTFAIRLLWKFRRALGVPTPKVINELKAEHPRLVHAHFGIDALDAWPIARALELPMLVTLHGYDINTYRNWWEAGNAGLRMRLYPWQLLRLAQQPNVLFVAVSKALRQRAIEFGLPEEKVVIQYIGIDPAKFAPSQIPVSQRPPRVVFIGRLVEKKGCCYLIEAMAKVQHVVPKAELVVVGDGPLRSELEHLARLRRVRAVFRGALTNQDVRGELDSARVFCLPSITAENGDAEGLPISILEAQASGVPVVTSARGAVGEAVKDEVSGLTFPERDFARLADQLIKALTTDSLADDLSKASVAMIANCFDSRLLTSKLEALYDDLALTRYRSATIK
jgi:glycosyltransferase involved in cell wall biosynthesis